MPQAPIPVPCPTPPPIPQAGISLQTLQPSHSHTHLATASASCGTHYSTPLASPVLGTQQSHPSPQSHLQPNLNPALSTQAHAYHPPQGSDQVNASTIPVTLPALISRSPLAQWLFSTWIGNIVGLVGVILAFFSICLALYLGVTQTQGLRWSMRNDALQACLAAAYRMNTQDHGFYTSFCNETIIAGVSRPPFLQKRGVSHTDKMPPLVLVLVFSTWIGTGIIASFKGMIRSRPLSVGVTVNPRVEDEDWIKSRLWLVLGSTLAVSGCVACYFHLHAAILLYQDDFSSGAILQRYSASFVTLAALTVPLAYNIPRTYLYRPSVSLAKVYPQHTRVIFCERCLKLESAAAQAEVAYAEKSPVDVAVDWLIRESADTILLEYRTAFWRSMLREFSMGPSSSALRVANYFWRKTTLSTGHHMRQESELSDDEILTKVLTELRDHESLPPRRFFDQSSRNPDLDWYAGQDTVYNESSLSPPGFRECDSILAKITSTPSITHGLDKSQPAVGLDRLSVPSDVYTSRGWEGTISLCPPSESEEGPVHPENISRETSTASFRPLRLYTIEEENCERSGSEEGPVYAENVSETKSIASFGPIWLWLETIEEGEYEAGTDIADQPPAALLTQENPNLKTLE
ncbi:hypothetical protein K431DRAFT_297851 [Polychaeton citri CBS 116435]|uniref:Uncharacterized protein n=1 Tax=Polychaeton citri CBS 116435 TaxID=1314669 RepID=A0A9P4Q0R9_9PEZI|nr:hypothetical protein K431DRAFT_297851 [Polychaeton citri CBS 116435]